MTRRRTGRRGSRLGMALPVIVVILLGGAVLNSGGGAAVAWAVGIALVATAAHATSGKRPRRRARRR